jgi:hypothetical protein
LFRYQAKTTAHLFFQTGNWQTSDYRRWGLSFGELNVVSQHGEGFWEGWHGVNELHSYFPGKVLRPNEWYYLLVRMGKSGQVIMKVWKKDDPTNRADFQQGMPSNWIGHRWQFVVQVYDGTVEMDEYQELSFDTP